MSKRCCAASCFNAVSTNRSVEYFGFPKSMEYAAIWAKAASREDLLEKNINNITKYFLCSEHFTEDCFLDPPYNRKLKKTTRPVKVPTPTIFRNNFHQCVTQSLNEEHLTSERIYNVLLEDTSTTNTMSEETLLDGEINDLRATNLSCDKSAQELEIEDGLADEGDSSLRADALAVVASYGLHDMLPQSEKDDLDILDDTLEPNIHIFDDTPSNCRLCLSVKENELLIPIFTEDSKIECILDSIIPGEITLNDGFSQYICLECLESATRCLKTIQRFKVVQNSLRSNK
ncbi:uncharacterized protein LOC129738896 [Uranotaenia lowii]|uniref:uncharacterized protein LOC129738896 n=1 Tax=Uranotaenia lowii TaxID=190385 RepID=UPI002478FFE5|nr:uncharacterized protein LOC129738896 [Uranotaenia lowii]